MFVGFNAHITEQGVFSPYFKDFGQGYSTNRKTQSVIAFAPMLLMMVFLMLPAYPKIEKTKIP